MSERDPRAPAGSGPAPGSGALVTSKLRLPPLPRRHVARPRLDARIAPADGPTVTIVSAQAGWGKTIAVRDWITRTDARVAWLTFDASDDHPVRFWYDVLTAVDAAIPGAGWRAVDALVADGGSDDAVMGVLVGDVARAGGRLVLVLDDLHMVGDQRVHASLEHLVEHAPAELRFVLITRTRPPLPLARWRARGLLGEVTERELAFRRDEAAALLRSFDGPEPDDEVDALVEETEGWAAGLQLAALSSAQRHGGSAAAARLPAGSGPVAELLMREVVDVQPADVREFLRATSIVECFDAELCRALTGRSDAHAVLRTIEDHRLFLVALDDRRERFRYHQLFRELLAGDLERRDPERFRQLHDAAGRWFASHGDVRLAVRHLLRAGDADTAFELAIAAATRTNASRSGQSDWLDLLPHEYVGADPIRMARFIVALAMRSSFTDAAVWLERAEAVVAREPSPSLERRLRAMRAVLSAIRGDAEGAVEEGVALLPIATIEWTDVVFERLPLHLARSFLTLGDVASASAIVEVVAARDGLSDDAALIVVPAVRATVAVAEGRLRDAQKLASGALRHATAGPQRHFGTLDANLALARVHLERDDITAAEDALAEVDALATELDSVMHATYGELSHAMLDWRRDDLDGASSHLAAARACAAPSGATALLRVVDALEARIRVRAGQLDRAAALVDALPDGVGRELLRARLELRSDPAAARRRLDALQPTTQRDRIVGELMRAQAATGDGEAAACLRAATELARPEGFVQVFWEERAPSPAAGATVRPLPEPLSDRELVVLRHLEGDAGMAEIASALIVSRNTLKSHVRAIYRKLDVGSREEAVRSARQRGLL